MICKKCGEETDGVKFCTKCGADLKEQAEAVNAVYDDDETVSQEVKRARENVKSYEEGTIQLVDKTESKRKFYCPKNPMLASFLALLAFGAVLAVVDIILWNSGIEDPMGIIAPLVFLLLPLAILTIGVIYFLLPSVKLDRLFKGKGVLMEYRLAKDELEEQAQRAKKNNRIVYIIGGVLALLFTVFYAYRITSAEGTPLLWASFWISLAICAAFIVLLVIMPKVNYEMMMENGGRVIIGEKSVYYGGRYYWWSKIEPKLTYGNYNQKKEQLVLTYTSVKKDGATKKKRVEIFAPERELKGITKMLSVFEINVKEYRLQEEKNKIITSQTENEVKS